ncbi:hypothetical protein [Candidatus Chromulinivorax destructor]|uniref:Uncharacterized protein n=1 Tax=Candidatus Chromulinivorax destructor TaxID=2066483 RepID=A0A345ZAJ2_9BACT|nr:hypothetical protein [Candidatus Chromulinivorax destructor]AXK60309.1 hypothetical protein C0J27_00895 [Candidatus Chromulinivorax destructor]
MRVVLIFLYCIVFLHGNVVQSMHQYIPQSMTSTEFFQFSLLRCGGRYLHQTLNNTVHYNDVEDQNIVIAAVQASENFPIGQVEHVSYESIAPQSSQNFIHADAVESFIPVLYAVNSSRHVRVIYEERFTPNRNRIITIPAVSEQEYCNENTRNCLNCCVFSTVVSLACFGCIFYR